MRLMMPASSIRRFVPLFAVGVLAAGCASYGSFDENEPGLEQSLLGDVTTVLGGQTNDEEIEYNPRPPLVAPPQAAALPAPQDRQTVAAADPNWPTGSRERMAQVLQNEDRMLVFTPGVDGVDIEASQALAARQSEAPTTRRNADVSDRLTLAEMRREQEIEMARQEGRATREAQAGVRDRRFLTDPPVSARAPSSEAPFGEEAEALAEAEQSGGFSWWPF